MNKILKSLILSSILLFSFYAVCDAAVDEPLSCCILRSDVALDGTPYTEGDTVGGGPVGECSLNDGSMSHNETKEWGLVCLLGSVGAVSRWIFIALMVVVPLMIITGAYYITTAGAQPEKVATGKNFIIWATVGLLVGLFSNAIPNFISSLITG